MASIDNLEAWKLGVDVAVRVCRLKGCKPLVYYPELGGQLARAALSVPANVAEGYALGTRAQMVRGLRIAFGSALELRTHLEVALRIPAVPDSEATRALSGDIRRLNAMLVGLLKRYGARPERVQGFKGARCKSARGITMGPCTVTSIVATS